MALLFGACVSVASCVALAVFADSVSEKARQLHFSSIVVDTHDDTTQRFLDGDFDLGARSSSGSIDIPRMKEGGLGAIFFSIWIPSKITGPEAVRSGGAAFLCGARRAVHDADAQRQR